MDNKFRQYAREDMERSKAIEKELIEFVRQHDNFIDMRNEDGEHDNCYGIIYDEFEDRYVETRIVALTTFDYNALGVLTQGEFESFEDLTKEDLTNEEMLESDNWVTIFGGRLWINATIVSICECVEQYAE